MTFGRNTVQGCRDTSHELQHAILQHAEAIQILSDMAEDCSSTISESVRTRVGLLHESATFISQAGLEIAAAGERIANSGDRIATCGEHIALGLTQVVYVLAAGMLTVVTALFGWRYLVLGCLCLWLSGFEIHRRKPEANRAAHVHHDETNVEIAAQQPAAEPAAAPAKQTSERRVSFEQVNGNGESKGWHESDDDEESAGHGLQHPKMQAQIETKPNGTPGLLHLAEDMTDTTIRLKTGNGTGNIVSARPQVPPSSTNGQNLDGVFLPVPGVQTISGGNHDSSGNSVKSNSRTMSPAAGRSSGISAGLLQGDGSDGVSTGPAAGLS